MFTLPITIIISILIGIICYISITLYRTINKLKKIEEDIENKKFLEKLYPEYTTKKPLTNKELVTLFGEKTVKEVNKDEDKKKVIISNIVKAVKDNTIKKESSSHVSLKNIANKIKDSKNLVTVQDEIDFWEWIDKEIAKMSDQEREELQKLINK